MSNEYGDKNLKIFSLNSNPELAKEIADNVGVQLESALLQDSVTERSRST